MALTKDKVSQIADRKRREVDVPEWGDVVVLQEMGALDFYRFLGRWRPRFDSLDDGDAATLMELWIELAAKMIVDPVTGELLFEADDLARHAPSAIAAIGAAAMELTGFTKSAAEELEKNSGTTGSDDGGSDSHGSADTPIRTSCSPV